MLPSVPQALKITIQNIRIPKVCISVMTNDQHTCNVLTKEWEKKLVAEEIQIFFKKNLEC